MIRIGMAPARRITAVASCLAITALLPGALRAQSAGDSGWRMGAAAGAFVPRAALIVGPGASDTRLGAGPSFSLEFQYLATGWAAIYASSAAAFSEVALGTAIVPTVTGPSDQVTVLGLTGGVVLAAPAGGALGDHLQPTLRLGGGLKGYVFDLEGAENQWRLTGDFGIGFRGLGSGPIEVSAEVRYLPSSFDQEKLPTRAIAPQQQRQTDLLFAIGVSVRP